MTIVMVHNARCAMRNAQCAMRLMMLMLMRWCIPLIVLMWGEGDEEDEDEEMCTRWEEQAVMQVN